MTGHTYTDYFPKSYIDHWLTVVPWCYLAEFHTHTNDIHSHPYTLWCIVSVLFLFTHNFLCIFYSFFWLHTQESTLHLISAVRGIATLPRPPFWERPLEQRGIETQRSVGMGRRRGTRKRRMLTCTHMRLVNVTLLVGLMKFSCSFSPGFFLSIWRSCGLVRDLVMSFTGLSLSLPGQDTETRFTRPNRSGLSHVLLRPCRSFTLVRGTAVLGSNDQSLKETIAG